MGYWEPNRLVSNSYMEGMIFKEMLEHPHVIKAQELGEIEIIEQNNVYGQHKTVYIAVYLDDESFSEWERFMFMDKLSK